MLGFLYSVHNYVNAAKGARCKIAYMKMDRYGSDCHLPNSVNNSFHSFKTVRNVWNIHSSYRL